MSLWDSIGIAITALRTNLMRSILTTLGIVIGVASVIILSAVGNGAAEEVERQINALGTNMLVVFPGSGRVMGRQMGAGTDLPLSEEDIVAIREKVPDVVAISGQLNDSGPVVRGNANWTTSVLGVHSDYTSIRDWRLESGRELTVDDVRTAARVALIGDTVAGQLFAGEEAVGAVVRIKNVPFEVVGVLARKGQSTMGRDQDDQVLVPISTSRTRLTGKSALKTDQVNQIYVKFDAGADLNEAQEDVESLLRQRRRKSPTGDDSFSVRNLAEFMKARTEVLSTLSYLLGATSIVSLVVGGIGIMNIMLVSVTERTREIGLRMAVGGRRRDILVQFLVEAVTLCLTGGLIGVGIGVGTSAVIALWAEWPVAIGSTVMGLALGAAAATGIVFGFVPARKAARLNPIEALRSE